MKKIIIALFFLLSLSFALEAAQKRPQKEQEPAQEAEQKMENFSFCGYTQKGMKSWEVKGNSADIFSDIVRLTSVNANVYGEEENINLVSDKGTYDKALQKMHLEDNVVVTTETGGRLTTDSLDWDKVTQKVTTEDMVHIEKQNIKAIAKGLEGQPDLKKVHLKENVQVEIEDQAQLLGQPQAPDEGKNKQPTIITCDGPLEIDYDKEIATFNRNVKADQGEQGQMYADTMEAYFDFKNKKVIRIRSTGNVKIVKGENTSYSDEAVYSAVDKKMTLTGRPRLVIYSEDKLIDAPIGN